MSYNNYIQLILI